MGHWSLCIVDRYFTQKQTNKRYFIEELFLSHRNLALIIYIIWIYVNYFLFPFLLITFVSKVKPKSHLHFGWPWPHTLFTRHDWECLKGQLARSVNYRGAWFHGVALFFILLFKDPRASLATSFVRCLFVSHCYTLINGTRTCIVLQTSVCEHPFQLLFTNWKCHWIHLHLVAAEKERTRLHWFSKITKLNRKNFPYTHTRTNQTYTHTKHHTNSFAFTNIPYSGFSNADIW